jgi:basic membrane protein A
MTKKLYAVMAVLMIASMLLAACAQPTAAPAENQPPAATQAPAASGGDCKSADVLCIGLVTDVGEVDDKSFNQSAWEGVQQAGTELNAQVKYVETKDAKDYASNMELFINQNYDVIVTVGFALGQATVEEAKKILGC